MSRDGLTPKQQRFVDEYLTDLNASAAARRAGYSKRTADAIGRENIRKPTISAAIAARRAVLAEEAGVTQRMVIDGLLREAQDRGDGSAHAARVAAWAHLGKHLGIFERDNAQKVGSGFVALLESLSGRG